MSSSATYAQNNAQRTPRASRRPASIAELAQSAKDDNYDERRELKYHLRNAEKYRRTAKELVKVGDLESAFVEFAKAATLVLEKLPMHRDYHDVLTPEQRQNLALNGQDILDSLSDLKPTLVERYERWLAAHPNAVEPVPTPPRVPPTRSNSHPQVANRDDATHHTRPSDPQQRHSGPYPRSSQEDARRAQSQADARRRVQEETIRIQEQEQRVAEELESWKRQREQWYPDERGPSTSRVGVHASDNETKRREEAARQRELDLTFSRLNVSDQGHRQLQNASSSTNSAAEAERKRQENALRSQQQQEEMRRREEEITRRRMEEKRRSEQEDAARRQREGNLGPTSLSLASAASSQYQPPNSAPSTLRAPTAVSSRPPSFLDNYPQAMPLESPTWYDGDSTDSEAVGGLWRNARMGKQRGDNNGMPSRAPARSPIYPPPITTTSPAPPDLTIRYPEIMSQHQKSQGYVPSLHSMFNPVMKPPTIPSSLLFEPESKSQTSASQSYSTTYNHPSLYPSHMLPPPSMPVPPSQPPYRYGPGAHAQQQQQHHPQHPYPFPQQQQQHQAPYSAYPDPPRASVPAPTNPAQTAPSTRITRAPSDARSADPVTRDLKTVNLPRECLPRFLSIAALNTSRNKETCGLLLGKDKEKKFVVTTLLIPKQHSTSDTCTMDEEELVLKFTEERSLITLGWIHTHPSQSCFMSSVDLHTHSGFQCMLPESFAVVCAPKSNPNFGIFRLTDPPGLQTILGCNAKEAFHPHPDLPIYTDADKGHVQMKDAPLEIVDLR